jgi:hypothetical protein
MTSVCAQVRRKYCTMFSFLWHTHECNWANCSLLKETYVKVHIIECLSFVLCSELSETTYRSHLQGSSWPLKMGPIGCRETSVTTNLRNVPGECRSRMRSTLLPNSSYPTERTMVYFSQQNLANRIRYVCSFGNNRKSFVIRGRCWVGSEGLIMFGIR